MLKVPASKWSTATSRINEQAFASRTEPEGLLLLVSHQSGAAESTLTERLVRDLMHLKQDSLDS